MKVKKLNPEAKLPTRSHKSAGYDLYSVGDWLLEPGIATAISLGFAAAIPDGLVGLIRDRSGLASKGVTTHVARVNKEALLAWLEHLDEDFLYQETILGGVIDCDYRGEWKVLLINTSSTPIQITKGDRVAQVLFFKLADPVDSDPVGVAELPETTRGEGGFGSTGN